MMPSHRPSTAVLCLALLGAGLSACVTAGAGSAVVQAPVARVPVETVPVVAVEGPATVGIDDGGPYIGDSYVEGVRATELRPYGHTHLSVRALQGQALGEDVARRAASLIGLRSLAEVSGELPDDCTGFVRFVLEEEGIALEGNVPNFFRRATGAKAVKKHNPRPGDLVFFHETYDRNRDGKRNDGLTHVGIVEAVAPDGTVSFVHRGSAGIARGHLNLKQPRAHRSARGDVLNDYLRKKSGRLRAYTTGELFSGYAATEKL